MFSGKPNSTAKKPVIRKTTVQVPISKVATPNAKPATQAPARPHNTGRFTLTQSSKSKQRPAKTVQARALASSRGVKRKSASPAIQYSDESDDEGSSDIGGSDSDASRKRIKSSVSSVESLAGPRRNIVSDIAFSKEQKKPLRFIHGADLTSGKEEQKFQNPWESSTFATVELLYPSRSRPERFELKFPKKDGHDDYKPMEDIVTTIETVSTFYLPDKLSAKYMDEIDGFARRLNRAFQRQSVDEWVSIIDEYNALLRPLVEDGTIQRELGKRTSPHLDWIKRILDQIFVRTVSPQVEKLNSYKAGTDNVYGELLPRFVSDIFKKTGLTHEQMFIDLGSGVGNVVLQAALEVGCESWGIEQMPHPCDLAALQAKEFKARSQLWGLNVGSVDLLRGDMTEHPQIPALLQRADVVLVNNQAFTPTLNDKLINMFLDLKQSAKVVSLKPFVPEGHKMAERNIDSVVNQFVQEKGVYFSDSVSWSHYGNENWYIATKDSRPLRLFRKRLGLE